MAAAPAPAAERGIAQPGVGRQHDEHRQRGRHGPDCDEPRAPEREVEERQDHDERAERVPDRLGAHQPFHLEGDRVAAGEADARHRQVRARVGMGLLDLALHAVEVRVERPAEHRVERRPARAREHEPAAAVGRHIRARRGVELHAGSGAGQPIAEQHEQAERIGADELGDFGAGQAQELARGRELRRQPRALEAIEDAWRRRRDEEQHAIRHVPPIAPAIARARIDPLDLGDAAQRRGERVDGVPIVVDRLTFGRVDDDVEIVEAPEALEVVAERRYRDAIARHEVQDVGVEVQAPQRPGRDDGEERRGREHRDASGVGPAQDRPDHGLSPTARRDRRS